MRFNSSNRARAFALAFLFPAGSVVAMGPAVYQAEPGDVIWEGAATSAATLKKQNPDFTEIRQLIEYSRHSGDLRALGRARAALNSMTESGHEQALLQATIDQRLHQFGDAKKRLQRILRDDPKHRQAQFTLYSIALVQGDYALATTLCEAIKRHGLRSVATSCHFNLMGLQGNPEAAFEGLNAAIEKFPPQTDAGYAWALGTLAELAAAIDHPDTAKYYRSVLATSPDDHYSASEYADWLLRHGKAAQAYTVLAGRPDTDRLILLRAIALKNLNDARSDQLIRELANRFERSERRQEDIHRHERARFLLDIRQQPQAALALAERNIATQQERADWRLLRRAQTAVSNTP